MRRSTFAALATAAVLIAILTGLSAATAHSAPSRPGDAVYAAWIPPGEYTAIVLCSNADTRRWNVRLVRTAGHAPSAAEQQVSVVVPPRQMVVIPFERGWHVLATDKARIESDLVPFEEFAQGNPVTGEGNVALAAWGIGPAGPVSFAYRKLSE